MIQDIQIEYGRFIALVKELPRTATIAASRAIDRATSTIVNKVEWQMLESFKRPTPYTIKSLNRETTEKRNMIGVVYFAKPLRMQRTFLAPQVEGGTRKMRGFERALQTRYGTGFFAMGNKYPRNQYGNIPGSLIHQMLTTQNAGNSEEALRQGITEASRQKNRKPRAFFYRKPVKGKAGGIFERIGRGGRGIRAFMVEIRTPNYKARLPFYQIARQVANTYLNRYFDEELAKDVAKKGWRK